MTCIHLAAVFLSLSICHQEGPPRWLAGSWVGMLETGGEARFVHAEFTPSGSGLTGTLHVDGAADMTLVRASDSDGSVGFHARRGDDELIFVGGLRDGAIAGRAHRNGEQARLELHRVPGVDWRVRAAVPDGHALRRLAWTLIRLVCDRCNALRAARIVAHCLDASFTR